MTRSWGNQPVTESLDLDYSWPSGDLPNLDQKSIIPHGLGRSYGDVAQNNGNVLVTPGRMNHILDFDTELGVLRCESGISIAELLEVIVPQGWFLPVTPGTKFVTIGGMIANDVHGKNHHSAGNIGHHILDIQIKKSNGALVQCSPDNNLDFFNATIGGMGLTGYILEATVQLIEVKSAYMHCVTIPFDNYQQGLKLLAQHSNQYRYSVAWIDSMSRGNKTGRGILTLAEHSADGNFEIKTKRKLSVPIYFPRITLNKWTVKTFNWLYFHLGNRKSGASVQNYDSFFYPLDSIGSWNKIYGKSGFFQYQFLIPMSPDDEVSKDKAAKSLSEILRIASESGTASFLTVLKTFGEIKSHGLMSFPSCGVTVAMDFPNRGESTLALLDQLDSIVTAANGKVYPAKDARMSPDSFKHYYPNWKQFSHYIDPNFSSSFWRRVTSKKK